MKLSILIIFITAIAFAGKCVITETRTSCPGQEKECFDKCKGQPSCDVTKVVGSEDACKKEAFKNCTVFRPGITKNKKMTAKFDNKDIDGGKDLCAEGNSNPDKAKEFGWNTCK